MQGQRCVVIDYLSSIAHRRLRSTLHERLTIDLIEAA